VSGAQGKAAELEQARTRLSEPPLRSTLLFVDNLHLSFSSLNRVKETLRRLINERLTDQDMVALATSGQTLGLAQQFTRDRQLLKYAIEQIRLGPASHEELFTSDLAAGFIAQHIDAYRLGVSIVRREEHIDCPCGLVRNMARARALQILSEASYSRKTTFSILKDFAEQMIGLPGKRMIVVFSDGFTMREIDGGVHYDQLQSAIDRAVRSGVVIYSIDAKGLQIHPTIDVSRPSETNNPTHQYIQCPDEDYDPRCDPPTPEQLTTSMSLSEREEQNGLHAMAEQTGGVLYTGNNDLDIPLGQAFDANRFFYVLSYYLEIDRQ
jgi:VWFA-related protein